MSNRDNENRLIDQGCLRAALILAAFFVFWWVRQRRQAPQVADRPVIWRRDIEMGPTVISESAGEENALLQNPRGKDLAAASGVPEAEAQAPRPVPFETPASDDLEIIEGIGPKINSILQASGIYTFNQLSNTEVPRLEEIRIANPQTWPEQASLAGAGEWSKLEAFQNRLKGGRRG